MRFEESEEVNITRWGSTSKIYISDNGQYKIRYFDMFEGMPRNPTYTIILMKNGREEQVIGQKRAMSGAIKLCNSHLKKQESANINIAKRIYNRRKTDRGIKL